MAAHHRVRTLLLEAASQQVSTTQHIKTSSHTTAFEPATSKGDCQGTHVACVGAALTQAGGLTFKTFAVLWTERLQAFQMPQTVMPATC